MTLSWLESAKAILLINAIVQLVLFFNGVWSSGNIRQLEQPKQDVGVLVASDETDAAAGGATSISFNLEFAPGSRSAEIYLVDNIGRVPGFYDQAYKQKVGLQLRRNTPSRPNNNNQASSNVTLNAYYQWPTAGIRGWSEGFGQADSIFGKPIWIDIAIDRRSHPTPLPAIQVYDGNRQNLIFKSTFNGRADYSLRPKVEYRVTSDLPFSIVTVLSFVGQETARSWSHDYARNSTPPPTVPIIRISGNDVSSPSRINQVTESPVRDEKRKIFLNIPEGEIDPSGGVQSVQNGAPGSGGGNGSKRATATPAYESWLPPPTWLLITSGCLLFFLFIVFTGTVLYLCSRRPGFIFVTDEDSGATPNQHLQVNHHSHRLDGANTTSSPSLTPSSVVRRHMVVSDHSHVMNGSTSPMMAESPDDDFSDNSSSKQHYANIYRYQSAEVALTKPQQPRGSLLVSYTPDEIAEEEDVTTCESDQMPRRQTVLKFAPSTKR